MLATQKKAIERYYKELADYGTHNVTHETAVRSAFQNLLSAFAQSANWILIPEQPLANGKRPDGTLRDSFNLPRGYWEAKDTRDDLDNEIRKKITIGYPISNTIFEDSRRAVLYQGNKVVGKFDLTQPKELAEILDRFVHYAKPDIENFEHAVTCVRMGKQLMELHLNYEQAAEYRLKWVENRDVPVHWRVEKMRLTPNKDALVVNELAQAVTQEDWMSEIAEQQVATEGSVSIGSISTIQT